MKMGTRVALFPSVGMGHFIPFCALAERLSQDFRCSVTFILFKSFATSSHSSPYIHRLCSSCPHVSFEYLPNVDTNTNRYKEMTIEDRIVSIILDSLPLLKEVLQQSSPSAFITDMFCAPIIKDIDLPTYIFFTSPAALFSLMYLSPEITMTQEMDELDHPGLPRAFSKEELPGPMWVPEWHRSLVGHSLTFRDADGILINTFDDLEGHAIEELTKHGNTQGNLPSLYTIGPLVYPYGFSDEDHQVVEWLDLQPESSVVFVSFGSSAAMTIDQVKEIAPGLEKSGERFLWVVRKMVSDNADDDYFSVAETSVEEMLPLGFLERTRDRGLVVGSWAPQFAILGHKSLGGFVTHCGWNSVLESMWCGVPTITWPIFGDQNMSAGFIVKDLGVGVGLRKEQGMNGFVKGEELAKAVKELMGGKKGNMARKKAYEVKKTARESLDVGQSSWMSLASAISRWNGLSENNGNSESTATFGGDPSP